MLHQIQIGHSLWAFTRKRDGRYALAAELVVSAKTMNPRGFRYGPYRVWGDLQRSRYFQIDTQPDISLLIRNLSVPAKADVLGRSFQGKAAVRALSEADHLRLLAYAESLPLEPRARLLPEEKLEALLLAGDEDAVANPPVLPRNAAVTLCERRFVVTAISLTTSANFMQVNVRYADGHPGPSMGLRYAKRTTSIGLVGEAMTLYQIWCSSARTTIGPSTAAMRRLISSPAPLCFPT